MELTPAALSADGGALPATVAPAVPTGAGLVALSLERADGTPMEECREGEALGVRIAWRGPEELPNANLRVELRTAVSGRLVAVSSERVGGSVLTNPLAASGELRVNFDSLAVRPGSYRVEVQLRPTAAVDAGARLQSPLEILPASGDGTLLPLSARWELASPEPLSEVGS